MRVPVVFLALAALLCACCPSPRLRGEGGAQRRVRGRAVARWTPPHPPSGHLLPRAAGEKGNIRRALLIGIDDYTASTLPRVGPVDPGRERGWPDLKGAANDVDLLAELLLRYGFERQNIVVLKNQQATRAAILRSLEHLARESRKGDIAFYYFAGHGAQVPNPASDELDRLDESIVPADSRRGAKDIRDKELRPLFNRILGAGAHLTLLLDHCHSGSGFRGRPRRGIGPGPPVMDGRDYGPRPDERGALVLAATQDLDPAWETKGEDGLMHGWFTWSWIRALCDAAAGEPAQETFLRAQARLRAEAPYQAPAMLGSAEARLRPFLDTHRGHDRRMVAVEKVTADGEVVLQGGWANGLAAGSELRAAGTRLRITNILGVSRSVAVEDRQSCLSGPRDRQDCLSSTAVRSGALLEIVSPRNDAWYDLESPHPPAPYGLNVRHEATGKFVRGIVAGGETYTIVLRASGAAEITPRYYYVFVVDSVGKSHLLFPRGGSVENRFPIGAPDAEIPLGRPSAFRVTPPYGLDTYYLLSTEEPLPNPSVLEWDGVRAGRALRATRWSIERITLESVRPGGGRSATRRSSGVPSR